MIEREATSSKSEVRPVEVFISMRLTGKDNSASVAVAVSTKVAVFHEVQSSANDYLLRLLTEHSRP